MLQTGIEEAETPEVVKRGRPAQKKYVVGNAFLMLRAYVNDKEYTLEEEVPGKEIKKARKRAAELMKDDNAAQYAFILVYALSPLSGNERVLLKITYLDAYPFFIDYEDIQGTVHTVHFETRQEAQAVHKDLDSQGGGVRTTNAFARKVK